MPPQRARRGCGESHKGEEQGACLDSPRGDAGGANESQEGSVAPHPTSHAPFHGARDGGSRTDAGHGDQSAERDAASEEPAQADEADEGQIGTLLELVLELRIELLGFQGSPS